MGKFQPDLEQNLIINNQGTNIALQQNEKNDDIEIEKIQKTGVESTNNDNPHGNYNLFASNYNHPTNIVGNKRIKLLDPEPNAPKFMTLFPSDKAIAWFILCYIVTLGMIGISNTMWIFQGNDKLFKIGAYYNYNDDSPASYFIGQSIFIMIVLCIYFFLFFYRIKKLNNWREVVIQNQRIITFADCYQKMMPCPEIVLEALGSPHINDFFTIDANFLEVKRQTNVLVGDNYTAFSQLLQKKKVGSGTLKVMIYSPQYQQQSDNAWSFFYNKKYITPLDLESGRICSFIFYIGMWIGAVGWFLLSIVNQSQFNAEHSGNQN